MAVPIRGCQLFTHSEIQSVLSTILVPVLGPCRSLELRVLNRLPIRAGFHAVMIVAAGYKLSIMRISLTHHFHAIFKMTMGIKML